MFKRHDYVLLSDPCCTVEAEVDKEDFKYYDKDGFELNLAERKFYKASFIDTYDCLNHICNQQPWLSIDHPTLSLDHCIILTRASYSGQALEQLKTLKKSIPAASYLINTKQKWGFDFALDSVDSNGDAFEVLHVEYDNRVYEKFVNQLVSITHLIYNTDWVDAAVRIQGQKDKWQHLRGFEQNHWKANYLLGWNKAEYTDKST